MTIRLKMIKTTYRDLLVHRSFKACSILICSASSVLPACSVFILSDAELCMLGTTASKQ